MRPRQIPLGRGACRRLARGLPGLAAALWLAGPGLADPAAPQRVVSINLCTDQLALMLAAPGQLRALTRLAQDPESSVMAARARSYRINHGRAEEVYLEKPDLVLAGRYTASATVTMLRGLGIRVETFAPAESFAELRASILRMGALLGREAEAARIERRFAENLARLQRPSRGAPPVAATWAAHGYMAGSASLTGEIITAAGFRPLARLIGHGAGGFMPLEALVMADPDLVILSRADPAPAHSEAVLDHPALTALTGRAAVMQDRDWICGLPAVLDAVDRLAANRPDGARE
ncbi:ABC transporter substrate-binding protein [Rhodobacter maris]|uniref:Iron complex transport system substrate-binding protein n=1 Tax=Rhodobacter maris TaxID=446682 RepID=A0A285RIH0_9RHOB|nr:ABC transporter substrate-binding protein [Rhodobacter maris]SOB93664.1 iron complex transport system substrate-binding protein [Rhodobacter maris]